MNVYSLYPSPKPESHPSARPTGRLQGGRSTERREIEDFALLQLDPRHTGANHLSEVALLQHAGALQWQAIASRAGMRMRELRAEGDRPVYASFYYAWIRFPVDQPISSHRIDDRLGFSTSIRLFGDTMIDGLHRLWTEQELSQGRQEVEAKPPEVGSPDVGGGAWIRMSNVFVAKKEGPAKLEVCSPTNLEPRRFPRSAERFDTYHKIKKVRSQSTFPPSGVRKAVPLGQSVSRIPINPDRDINGVGLVYFANYVTFLDSAERNLMNEVSTAGGVGLDVDSRSLIEREIAYYANAKADDVVEVEIRASRLERCPGDLPGAVLVRFDYRAHRCSDGRLLCVSTATKLIQVTAC